MRRARLVFAVASIIVLAAAGAAYAAFPQEPPNDPNFAPAEQSPTDCLTKSVNDEQHYLFSSMPQCTRLTATDPENASGMSVDSTWRDYTAGRPDVTIAYVEGGINWHDRNSADLATRVYVNRGEVPVPCTGSPCTTTFSSSAAAYDVNHDGAFNVGDYSSDPRVRDRNGNGFLDPEDLIVAFSNRDDHDGNGYVDDVSGWDFYDHQNDPATTDSSYLHANNQMRQAAADANNGLAGAGVCPRCTILPVKAGAEALDRTDDLAQAWLFAADTGAKVIVSVTADLGYSTFMRQTVEKLWRQGIVMVESSNDFDSTDHQGSMFWPHVLPGNGLVTNSQGVPGPAANALTTSYRERSGLTSWGTHNMFSVATDGGSTSESTPTVGGVAALVASEGLNAAASHTLASPLTGAEVIQVLRATASDVADPSLGWPGMPGWDLQYGYGRPNVHKAAAAVAAGNIPPVGWIDSPDWYAIYDPTHTSTVPVSGHVEARRSTHYTWQLQYGLGAEPTDAQFTTIGTGSGSAPFDGTLGTLDLSRIPQSFWDAPYRESTTKALEATEQYTVTLRVRVTDASGRVGEERRTIAVHHDPDLLTKFPLKFGPGGESQPALVDLQGTGVLDIVFGDDDGAVHAIDPRTGNELPGWPAHTDPNVVTKTHAGISPGNEAVLATVAVGDLDGTGALSVVVTTTRGKVYVFDDHGARRAGWPKALATGVVTPAVPRTALAHTRLPVQGATASPILDDLDGDGHLDVIQAAWDGHAYAWHANGTALHGWPVKVNAPSSVPPGHTLVNDQKIDATPAIADLDGDGTHEVVLRSQFTAIVGDDIQPGGIGYVYAFHRDGTTVAGWPALLPGLVEYYGSAQEFLTEGASVPVAADVNGDGKDEIAVAPEFTPTRLLSGNGVVMTTYGSDVTAAGAFTSVMNDPAGVLAGTTLPADVPINFTTSGAFGKIGGSLVYAEPGTAAGSLATALLLPGSGRAIQNVEQVYDAATGAGRVGFPSTLQGLDFLGAPLVTDVTGDGQADVVEATDSSALSAHEGTGALAPGFPKFTGGWTVFSPSAGDLLSDGTQDLVLTTREGYLFAWRTQGKATSSEWWAYRHDEHRSGRYGVDARPPGVPRNPSFPKNGPLSFVAPGDDWYAGTVRKYRARFGSGPWQDAPATVAAGATQAISVPAGTTSVSLQAVDDAGNLGPVRQFAPK
jgi:hypothetical protein